MQRRRSGGLRLALAASLVLHLCVLGWLWTRPPAPSPPASPVFNVPVEVRVVDVPPVRSALPPPPPPLPPRRAPKTRTRVERSERTPHEDSPEAAPAPLANDSPRAEDSPSRPSLLPSAETLAPLPSGSLPVTPPEPGPPGTRLHAPERPASPEELVAGTVRDSMAEARTRNGLSNSYFSGVGRALLRRFEKAQADAEREAKLGAKVRQKARDVSSVLSRSATMEDPLAQLRRPDPLAGLPSRPAVVEDAYKGLAYALPYDWTRTDGVVVVRLTQAADGHVLSAELLASSGDPGLDGAAVSSVQALGEESGPPPPEVRRGRDAVVSEWRFELLRTVSGPSALGVGFTGLPSFAGRSHVRVTLVAYH